MNSAFSSQTKTAARASLRSAGASGHFAGGEVVKGAVDATFSVTEVTFSVAEKTLSVAEKTFSVAEKTFSVTDKTLSATEKVLSAAQKTASTEETGLSRPEMPASASPKTACTAPTTTSTTQKRPCHSNHSPGTAPMPKANLCDGILRVESVRSGSGDEKEKRRTMKPEDSPFFACLCFLDGTTGRPPPATASSLCAARTKRRA